MPKNTRNTRFSRRGKRFTVSRDSNGRFIKFIKPSPIPKEKTFKTARLKARREGLKDFKKKSLADSTVLNKSRLSKKIEFETSNPVIGVKQQIYIQITAKKKERGRVIKTASAEGFSNVASINRNNYDRYFKQAFNRAMSSDAINFSPDEVIISRISYIHYRNFKQNQNEFL